MTSGGSAWIELERRSESQDAREKWSKAEELERPTLELDVLNTERTQKAPLRWSEEEAATKPTQIFS